MAIHDDAFEGVYPGTLRRLLDVLSFPLDIPKDGDVDPAKWIFDCCSGHDGTVSSLLLMESDVSTFLVILYKHTHYVNRHQRR